MSITATNPFRLDCGCLHRGPGHQWEKCVAHTRRDEIEAQMETELGAPKCPECNADARRQKCMWDMGGFCPRHPETEKWEDELNRRVRAGGTEP